MDLKVLLTDLTGTVYSGDEVYSEVPDTLKKLKEHGVKIIAVTAGDQELKEHKLKKLGIYDYFASVEASSNYGVLKSKVDMYSLVVSKLGLEREECLVVGNNEVNDIVLPNASGFMTVKIARGLKYYLPTVANYKIESYAKLLKFFK
jgi:phosphoglycolate phosphatase